MGEKADPANDSGSESVGAAGERYVEGQVVSGKYLLTKVIGKGGMGAVWLARNTVLDVDVAIKVIRRNVGTAEAGQRLLQEARAAARLGHPSIVRIFDFGETELGDPFIVMEVLDGDSLRTVLHDRGRLEAAEAVRMLLPVASALAAAHQKGIVHRDLKPDNIVLATDGKRRTPKVVDFGIAKLRVDDVDRRVTQAGTVLGSPDYMSPEQALGKLDVDERVDVWALAVVLYETLTGARPFDGPNYNALIAAITKETPPSILDFGAGDGELWAILERGLAKEPDHRWPSMQAFGRALAEWSITNGETTDITGTSLESEWMAEGMASTHPARLPSARGVPTTTTGRRARSAVGAPTTGRPLENGSARVGASRVRWIAVAGVAAAIGTGAWLVRSGTLGIEAGATSPGAPEPNSASNGAHPPPAPSPDRAAATQAPPEASGNASAAASAASSAAPRKFKLTGTLPHPTPSAKPSASPLDKAKTTPDVGF